MATGEPLAIGVSLDAAAAGDQVRVVVAGYVADVNCTAGTILTLFVIPALFSIVDDIRARYGKLDVDGEKHPSLEATFAEQMCRLDGAGRSADELDT